VVQQALSKIACGLMVGVQARFAVLGLRVNTECFCSGDNDLLFGALCYQETAGGAARYEFHYGASPSLQARIALTPTVIANRPLLHLYVAPGCNFGFNSRFSQ
jgi:hypothetical protein